MRIDTGLVHKAQIRKKHILLTKFNSNKAMQISTGIKDFKEEMIFHGNHCIDRYGNEYEVIHKSDDEALFELKYIRSNFTIRLFKKRINDMQICLKKEGGIKRKISGKPYWTKSDKKYKKRLKKL